MATRHTVKCWIGKARDAAVFAMAIAFGFSSFSIAGLKVTKADVEVARKAQASTAQRVKELEAKLQSLEKEVRDTAAKAKAAKAELEEVEKSLTTSKADLEKREKEQPVLDRAAAEAAQYLEKIKKEVESLEVQQEALEEEIDENSSSISVPFYTIVPCADDDDAKEGDAKEEEKDEEEADEEDNEDLEEPGFWRKRALKKGEEPKTTGEKNWVAAWKKTQEAEKAAELAAEKAAKAAEEAAKKAEEEAAAKATAEEANRAAEEAKAKDLEEPGFWRKRALKKGEEPQTTGEKNWVAAWKKEQETEKAAKTAAEESEKAAETAAEEAEKAAETAEEKAEREAAAKAAAEEAKRVEEEAKREAEEAKAKDLEEPGFFRKRALKKGEEPQTTGEKNWVAAWKKEQAAEEAKEKAAQEAATAAEKAEREAELARKKKEEDARIAAEKAERERIAKEEAERAAEAAEAAKAKDLEEPGFWRQRALKRGEEPVTTGEKQWVAKWKAEEKRIADAEAAKEKAETEAEKAKREAEERREKAEALADAEEEKQRLEREKADRLARENEEPGYLRKRALKGGAAPETAGERQWLAEWQKGEKERLAKELRSKAEKEQIVRIARAKLTKVNEDLINKRKELEVAETSAENKLEAKRANAEELERSRKLYERATEKIAGVRKEQEESQTVAEGFKSQFDSVESELKTLKQELANRQEAINKLLEQARTGQDKYVAAEAARSRYNNALGRTEGLQDKLEQFIRLAAENKNRIPDVKAEVEEATAAVIDAREAYEAYRKKIYNDTKDADKIESDIIIIDPNKKNKSSEEKELEPLAREVALAVKKLREVEKVAKQVYHDADFYEFSVRKTKRAIERNKRNLVRYKGEYEQAVVELEPWGTLDPLAPTKEEE